MVKLVYYAQSEHTWEMLYDPSGNWGPIGEYTELKFKSEADGEHQTSYLWAKED